MRQDVAVFECLERRIFLSAATVGTVAPSQQATAPAQLHVLASSTAVLTKATRQELLSHWSGPGKGSLSKKLKQNKLGGFDELLLNYMKNRAGTTFFWNTRDVEGIKNFINTNLATASTISNAENVVAHRFPNGNSQKYDVQLPSGDINWNTSNSNPEFVYTLNRHDFWIDLAQAYVLTGNDKYVKEMIAQLTSWSKQNPAVKDPNEWSDAGTNWQPLSTGIRADNWSWAYQMVLGSSGWTASANTLFLYKLYQHADFLRRVDPYELTSNRALFEAQGLLEIAHLVPEFTASADWKSYGRKLLFGAMDAQLNPDGGHAEASPGYASAVISSLLEMYYLDAKKGDKSFWTTARRRKLLNAAKAHVQLLTPDSKTAALSDTYRTTVGPFWLRPRIILADTADFPAAKPRLRDVWLFGTNTTGSLLGAPISPGLPDRGKTYSMPQSGYYVMRSGSDYDARQITFDAGPTGGEFHGHYDLLSFELFGYGKPLISDPGVYAYNNSARRKWAISTPAHNTISIDNRNHDGVDAIKNGNIATTNIVKSGSGYQITASHKAYGRLSGSPVVTRGIWYDGNDTMLVADFGQGSSTHTYSQSFLLPSTNTSRDLGGGWIRTNNDYGNVKIQSVLTKGQAAHLQTQIPATSNNVFVSNDPDSGVANNATRYYVDQKAATTRFVSLVTSYSGSQPPDITAKVVSKSATSSAFSVRIYRNGQPAELVSFSLKVGSKSTSSLSGSAIINRVTPATALKLDASATSALREKATL
ncbi:MAG TPA: alginate lyase family protein [Tepidisphaeraceae bacterium]